MSSTSPTEQILIHVAKAENIEDCRCSEENAMLGEGITIKFCKTKDSPNYFTRAFVFNSAKFTTDTAKEWVANRGYPIDYEGFEEDIGNNHLVYASAPVVGTITGLALEPGIHEGTKGGKIDWSRETLINYGSSILASVIKYQLKTGMEKPHSPAAWSVIGWVTDFVITMAGKLEAVASIFHKEAFLEIKQNYDRAIAQGLPPPGLSIEAPVRVTDVGDGTYKAIAFNIRALEVVKKPACNNCRITSVQPLVAMQQGNNLPLQQHGIPEVPDTIGVDSVLMSTAPASGARPPEVVTPTQVTVDLSGIEKSLVITNESIVQLTKLVTEQSEKIELQSKQIEVANTKLETIEKAELARAETKYNELAAAMEELDDAEKAEVEAFMSGTEEQSSEKRYALLEKMLTLVAKEKFAGEEAYDETIMMEDSEGQQVEATEEAVVAALMKDAGLQLPEFGASQNQPQK